MIEDFVLTTQTHLDRLAVRIEHAYRRRHPNWSANGLTPGVWIAAASRLSQVEALGLSMPVDPELFVAVQSYPSFRRDPWGELTQDRAVESYRHAIKNIVKQLRAELKAELRWSSRHLESGRSLEQVFDQAKSRISPIAKLALCHQFGRSDLAELIRPAAEVQHQACPLYRVACKNLMAMSAYPTSRPQPALDLVGNQAASFAWN